MLAPADRRLGGWGLQAWIPGGQNPLKSAGASAAVASSVVEVAGILSSSRALGVLTGNRGHSCCVPDTGKPFSFSWVLVVPKCFSLLVWVGLNQSRSPMQCLEILGKLGACLSSRPDEGIHVQGGVPSRCGHCWPTAWRCSSSFCAVILRLFVLCAAS